MVPTGHDRSGDIVTHDWISKDHCPLPRGSSTAQTVKQPINHHQGVWLSW